MDNLVYDSAMNSIAMAMAISVKKKCENARRDQYLREISRTNLTLENETEHTYLGFKYKIKEYSDNSKDLLIFGYVNEFSDVAKYKNVMSEAARIIHRVKRKHNKKS